MLHRPSGNFGLQKAYYQSSNFGEIRETQAEYRDSEFEGTLDNRSTRQTKSQSEANEGVNKNESQLKEWGFNLQRAGNHSMQGFGQGFKMIGLEEALDEDTEDTKDYTQLGVPLFKNMFYNKKQDQSVSLNLSKLKEESVILPSVDSEIVLPENKESNAEKSDSKMKLDDQQDNELDKFQPSSKGTTPLVSQNVTRLNNANIISGTGENTSNFHSQEIQKSVREDPDVFKKIALMMKEVNVLDELNDSDKNDSQLLNEEQKLIDISNYNQKHQYKNKSTERASFTASNLENKLDSREADKNKNPPVKGKVECISMKLDISSIQNLVDNTLGELDADQSFTSRKDERNSTKRSKQKDSTQKINSLEQLLLTAKSDGKPAFKFGNEEEYEVFKIVKQKEPQQKQKAPFDVSKEVKVVQTEGLCVDSQNAKQRRRNSQGPPKPGSKTSLQGSLAEIKQDQQSIPNKADEEVSEPPTFAILDSEKKEQNATQGNVSANKLVHLNKNNEEMIENKSKDINEEKFNTSYSNPFTEQESYASQEAFNVIEEFFKATLGKGAVKSEGKSVEVVRRSHGRNSRRNSLSREISSENNGIPELSAVTTEAHHEDKKKSEIYIRETFNPFHQSPNKMKQKISQVSQTEKELKIEGKFPQGQLTKVVKAQGQTITESQHIERDSFEHFSSREKVKSPAAPENFAVSSKNINISHIRSHSKGSDIGSGYRSSESKDVKEPTHNRPAIPIKLVPVHHKFNSIEGNPVPLAYDSQAFAANSSYEQTYSNQQFSITIRGSTKAGENSNYASHSRPNSRGATEISSHNPSQRNTIKDRESVKELYSSGQLTTTKLNLRPQDLYRVHASLPTDLNFSVRNQSYLQENALARRVPTISINSNLQSLKQSPRTSRTRFGLKNQGDVSFRPTAERQINMDVFCINCEEFVHMDQVDLHSTQCVQKTEQRRSRSRRSIFQNEDYEDFDQAKVEQTNQKIERIIMKLNEALKNYSGKRIRYEFGEYCKRIVKVARDVVSEDSNTEVLKKKMRDFDQLFDPMSRAVKNDEIELLFYIQRMFVELQNKAEAVEEAENESKRIAYLQEQLQACDREALKKKSELEMLQYQSDMLQTIQRNDSRNFRYLRNDLKKDLEIISQIHSEIASSSVQSDESAGTTESELFNQNARLTIKTNQVDREALRRHFYTEAVNIKLTLPPDHSGRDFLISELYDECIQKNIPKEEYDSFIKMKYQLI